MCVSFSLTHNVRCVTPLLTSICRGTLYVTAAFVLWCLPFALLVHLPALVPCIASLVAAGLILYALPFNSCEVRSSRHYSRHGRYLFHRRLCVDNHSRYKTPKFEALSTGMCKKRRPTRKLRRRHHGKPVPVQVPHSHCWCCTVFHP